MANTYTQIYIHIVFTVQGRHNLLPKKHLEELYKYITGILQRREQKLLAIGGMPDHVHVFIGLNPKVALSDLIRDMKAGSSGFINEQNWVSGRFRWQEGYGAFSYARSQVDQVCQYILNQEQHHRGRSFKEEYLDMLRKFAVAYEEQYLFDWVEEA